MSDLFLTVKDKSTGTSYYEIYINREKFTTDDSELDTNNSTLKGLNSYCLIAREEIKKSAVVQFTDVDRDGMIDMIIA